MGIFSQTLKHLKHNTSMLNRSLYYYAFGSQMPGRLYNSANYRYGFNGKENDNEVKGTGNQQDYGMRIYDPRLGKFLSVDPLTKDYPFLTPYQFASNTPIQAIDLDGLEKLYYLGAFDKGGKSTLLNVLNQSKTFSNAIKSFQNASKNSDNNAILIEGVSGNNRAVTMYFPNSQLKEILKSEDKYTAFINKSGGAVSKEQMTDQFINALSETANSGNNLFLSVISSNLVDLADSKSFVEKVSNRKQTAMTVGHELIAHVVNPTIIPGITKEAGEHQTFFGPRDKNGTLVNNGKDCSCSDDVSPAFGQENNSSTAGQLRTEIINAVSHE